MNRRRSNSLAGSPLLIGAVTTLIVVVAVFLSYNANNGLPFTPTYDIKVQLPEASGLQKGNQVRIGGTRVGVISALSPYQDPKTGRVTAIVSLKLEKNVQPLPANTTAIVQSVSTIGLKYLALEKGHGGRPLKPGETIPVSQTRIANQVNLTSFGNGLAGRGTGLNETIATLRPLVTNAIPVLRNLASPKTGFGELFVALDRLAKEVGPVANEQAEFYSNADTFFTAWASVAPSLEESIRGGPPALRQATVSLPFEAEFVNKSATFMRLLKPSAHILTTVAAPLGHAFSVGAVNVRAATALSPEINESLQAFATFAKNPIVTTAIEDLTHTLGLGNPLLAGLAPEQMKCNYVTLAFRNLASLLSESVGVGTLGRAAPMLSANGPNNEGLPASAPANGPAVQNHLHINPYPNVSGPGQPQLCEAGNEVYKSGETIIGHAPSTKKGTETEKTSRETDTFGKTYPASTLEALGFKTSKGSKK
jgi:phospholipid/cholesterol/gamma-HCH transport system substrate-binding protein